MEGMQIVFAILMGFSLAATCGLRAFLPLLVIGIAAKTGFVDLSVNFEWMMSWPAIICFGSATVLEILGDKIPAVDHFLDSAGVVVRPVAGAIAASSMIQGMEPLTALVVGIIMGATVAGIVQFIKGSLRLVSTATTGGIANPAMSVVEDGATASVSILSIFVPVITAVLIMIGLVFGIRFAFGKLCRRKQIAETVPVQTGNENV